MYREPKYPRKYRTCNDTCTACRLLCCKRLDKVIEDDVLITKEEEAQKHFLWQKVVDQLVEKLNGNWSWASAGLLFTACQATISLIEDKDTELAANWTYFFVIFFVGVAAAFIEHSFESPETIAQELELKVPRKKSALGCQEAIKQQTEEIKRAETIAVDDDDRENVLHRILKFVQIEGNVLFENLENLFLAIIANVTALALNAAAGSTFDALYEDSGFGKQLTAQWIWAMFIGVLSVYLSVKLGKKSDQIDIKTYDILKEKGLEHSKADLLQHSTKKRVIKLCEYSLGLVWAWALRDTIKASIFEVWGEDDDEESLAALWAFAITSTLLVAMSNTVVNRYYILYPKDDWTPLQFETEQRRIIGKTIYNNFQAVVGIAWYDAIVEAPEQLAEDARETHRIWLLFLLAVSCMLFSNIAGAYWERAKLRFAERTKGPVTALFEAFDDWFDPQHVMDEGKRVVYGMTPKMFRNDEDGADKEHSSNSKEDSRDSIKNEDAVKDKVDKKRGEAFVYDYSTHLIDLLIYALGFASGWLLSAAVNAALSKAYEGVYDPDEVDEELDSAEYLCSIWGAFAICLIISTLIMTYLSKLVNRVREKRREIFEHWQNDLGVLDDAIDSKLTDLQNANDEEEEKVETQLLNERTENITQIEMQ